MIHYGKVYFSLPQPEAGSVSGESIVKKHSALKWILLVVLLALLGIGAACYFYLRNEWERTTFFENTTVNGFDASGKTPEELVPVLENAYTAATVTLTESGEEQAVFSLDDLGYSVSEENLLVSLQKTLEKQKSSLKILLEGLMNGNTFQVGIPFEKNVQKLEDAAKVSSLKTTRVKSEDAQLIFNSASSTYSIRPEVQGNTLTDDQLFDLVESQVDDLVMNPQPQESLTIEIPADLYEKPKVLSTDPILTSRMNIYNAYDQAQVTYDFGDQTETIGWDTVKDWLIIDGDQGYLSQEKLSEFVTDLASRYNTAFYDRTFTTTYGNTITIPGSLNEYGYLVDEDGEYNQLLADLQSNSRVEREPVYSRNGIQRSGRDDLAGTYVEINLSAQHLWAYKDYGLIVESDIVSGSVAKQSETQTGCFPIAYKESPAVLTGQDAANGWRTDVSFWMPFYDGQGLHDATWRSAFGGNIYQTNGSHGCVNLPYDTAAAIFNYMPTGAAIILYK